MARALPGVAQRTFLEFFLQWAKITRYVPRLDLPIVCHNLLML